MSIGIRSSPVNVFWFRRDLRLKDNHGLHEALTAGLPVVPIFVFDPAILDCLDSKSDARVEFILSTLSELNRELLMKHKSSIQIFHASPQEAFRKITAQYQVQSVFTNEDYEPYALERDAAVARQLKSEGIALKGFKDQVIFAPGDCLKGDGSPYLVFTPYSRQWKKQLRRELYQGFRSENHLKNFLPLEPTTIESLKDLGFEKSGLEFPPKTLSKNTLRNYRDHRNFPALERGTTHLGLHLRFGSVSVRHCVATALELSEAWLNELIWREFFMAILFHFPHTETRVFKEKYARVQWREDRTDFKLWCEGQTGYPIVDAGMRELVATGFMHNRVRMITASFLCKHLLLPWTWGERFFARHLLDFELASNVGNWQWVAGCGVDAAPYFRVFNPETQAKKFDPDGEYIKKWVPEVATPKYVEPMVDHEFARRRALRTYNEGLK